MNRPTVSVPHQHGSPKTMTRSRLRHNAHHANVVPVTDLVYWTGEI